MTRNAYPCDDPFCGGPKRGCGWTPPEHLGRPAPVTPAAAASPPSTVETMRNVLTTLDASRPRSLQTTLGPSELGTTCDRQIAMKLAGLPRQLPDKRPPWAPMQGTAMHSLMEEALRHHNEQLGRVRWLIEEDLNIADDYTETLRGHGDAYDLDHDMVVDWKYVGSTALKKVKRKTIPVEQLVSPAYRVQAHLYGYGHARAGREPKWVRLVLLARSHDYDESAEWTEPYRPDVAADAISRYFAIKDTIAKLPLEQLPQLWDVTIPAEPSDDNCAWCPFRRAGGPADGTGCPGNTTSKIDKQVSGLIAA